MHSCTARRRRRLQNAVVALLLHTARAFDFSKFGKKPPPKKPRTFQESLEKWKTKVALPADAGAFAKGTLAGVMLTVAVAVGPLGDSVGTEGREAREAAAQFEIVLDALDRRYVDSVSPKKLMESAITAMLATLDPYTEYSKGTQASDMIESVEGRYGGVGLVISGKPRDAKDPVAAMASGDVEVGVVDAYEDYAWEAGLRPRDTLVSIGGSTPSGKTGDAVLDSARTSLRGAPGSTVDIKYKHPWETQPRATELKRFNVRRRDVELVTLLPSPTASKVVAYARVAGFSRETAPELVEGLASLRYDSTKSKLEGVIIDLRGNPGGLLDAAIDVASLFLPPDAVIASAKGRGFVKDATGFGESSQDAPPERVEFKSRARGVTLYGVAPVIVLVDGQSASASEIVAGALQDYDAGVIIGQRTFGKGLIQDVSPLPFDGAALKVTVGRYYTPSGRCLQELDYEKERRLDTKKEVSAKESFVTVNSKRPIQSGGGVAPDLLVEPDTLTKAESALLRSGVSNRFADDWVDKRPDVAKALYDRGLEPDADAVTPILVRADLDALKQRALKAIADEQTERQAAVKAATGAGDEQKGAAPSTSVARREMEDAFRQHPDRILKVTDALVKDRFFRSSALLKAQVADERAVQASIKLFADRARFDAMLAPPAKGTVVPVVAPAAAPKDAAAP